ncbi:porin family protein [Bartonella alsatica]|uniref:Porin n=2 Tax=Bartonella alsatica TaxID=52764 RepID=J0PYX9_9HYPH|nr:outer membrane protein [Bartonella alsatica]EJF75404.1 hypothetical protein MEC_00880 [Bartonella alsatica IBS 382]QLC52257.1 porin family protein [Bartonella alsatica]
MNTKRLISASIFALISSSAAQAADVMIPRQPTPVTSSAFVAPTFTWTGLYLGAQVGGLSSKIDMSMAAQGKTVPLSKDLSPKFSGFEGGLYAGSNIDLGDNFVFGIDTDLTWSGKKHSKTITIASSNSTLVENVVSRTRRSAPSGQPQQESASSSSSSGPSSSSSGVSSPESLGRSDSNSGGRSASPVEGRSGESGASTSARPQLVFARSGSEETQRQAGNGAGGVNHHGSGNVGANADKNSTSVYGIEQVKREIASLALVQGGKVETLSHTLKQNWVGATRVRIGFTADRFMPYIAGGVAYTRLQDTISVSFKKSNTSDANVVSSKNLTDEAKTVIGYTLGGGIDFAMLDNVIVRAEYRYSDFGKKKFAKEKLEVNYKTNDFRVGIAYKF